MVSHSQITKNIMGMLMSRMKGTDLGITTEGIQSKTLDLVMGRLCDEFIKKDIKDFRSFYLEILELFNSVNHSLPGKHYIPPPTQKLSDELFKEWKALSDDERKKNFTAFMTKNVNLNKVDNTLVITGLLAPQAAWAAKRTGQVVPQLSFIKFVPDVIFVPTATIVALIAVKISKIKLMKDVAQS